MRQMIFQWVTLTVMVLLGTLSATICGMMAYEKNGSAKWFFLASIIFIGLALGLKP